MYDKKSDELVREIKLDEVPLKTLKEFVTPKLDDDLLFDPYPINPVFYQFLQNIVPELNKYNWEDSCPYLEAFAAE